MALYRVPSDCPGGQHQWIIDGDERDYCNNPSCYERMCYSVRLRKLLGFLQPDLPVTEAYMASRTPTKVTLSCTSCAKKQHIFVTRPRPEYEALLHLSAFYDDKRTLLAVLRYFQNFAAQIAEGSSFASFPSRTEDVSRGPRILLDLLGAVFSPGNDCFVSSPASDIAIAAEICITLQEEISALQERYVDVRQIGTFTAPLWELPATFPVECLVDAFWERFAQIIESESIEAAISLLEWACGAIVKIGLSESSRTVPRYLRPVYELVQAIGHMNERSTELCGLPRVLSSNGSFPHLGTDTDVTLPFKSIPSELRKKYLDYDLPPLFGKDLFRARCRRSAVIGDRERPTEHVSLLNTGSLCWLNATLSALFFTSDVRRAVASFAPTRMAWKEKVPRADENTGNGQISAALRVIHLLQLVFSFMGPSSTNSSVFTFAVSDAVQDCKVSDLKTGCSQDAGEFLFSLPSVVEEAVKARQVDPEVVVSDEITPIFRLQTRQHSVTGENEEGEDETTWSLLSGQMLQGPCTVHDLLRGCLEGPKTMKSIVSFPSVLVLEVGRRKGPKEVDTGHLDVPLALSLHYFCCSESVVEKRRSLVTTQKAVESMRQLSNVGSSPLISSLGFVKNTPLKLLDVVDGASSLRGTLENMVPVVDELARAARDAVDEEVKKCDALREELHPAVEDEVPVVVARILEKNTQCPSFSPTCGEVARILQGVVADPSRLVFEVPKEDLAMEIMKAVGFTSEEDGMVFRGRVAVLPEVCELLCSAAHLPCELPPFDTAELARLDKERGVAPPEHLYYLNAAVVYGSEHFWCFVRNRQQLKKGPVGKQLWLRCDDRPVEGGMPRPPTPVSEAEALEEIAGSKARKCGCTLLFYVKANSCGADYKYDSSWISAEYEAIIDIHNSWLNRQKGPE